jgi:hypothetical protein
MEVFYEDLINDGVNFCSFLKVWHILSLHNLNEVFEKFSILEICEEIIFKFPLSKNIKLHKFLEDQISVIYILWLKLQS